MCFYHKIIIGFLCLLIATSVSWAGVGAARLPARQGSEPIPTPAHQADQLENQAVELIDNDQMTGGLKLMKKAIDIDPTPMRHMNYGSILFGNGVADYKDGHQQQALITLKQAEDELNQAIKGFDPKQEGVFLAQAYFLLGEISLNAFSDKTQAKTFYRKALSYYDNEGAKAALVKLQ